MKLGRFFKVTFFLTIMSLVYIHMQMEILALAYQGKELAVKIQTLKDRNGVVRHDLLTLKSASHLGRELLKDDSALQFASEDQIIEFEGVQEVAVEQVAQEPEEKVGLLSKLFSAITPQAEARSLE